MIYTAPCVMFFMRARTLRGGALEIETFLGPERARADRRVPFGAQKVQISRAQPPRNVLARMKNITLREVYIIGA